MLPFALLQLRLGHAAAPEVLHLGGSPHFQAVQGAQGVGLGVPRILLHCVHPFLCFDRYGLLRGGGSGGFLQGGRCKDRDLSCCQFDLISEDAFDHDDAVYVELRGVRATKRTLAHLDGGQFLGVSSPLRGRGQDSFVTDFRLLPGQDEAPVLARGPIWDVSVGQGCEALAAATAGIQQRVVGDGHIQERRKRGAHEEAEVALHLDQVRHPFPYVLGCGASDGLPPPLNGLDDLHRCGAQHPYVLE
mmetsp:Transcript_22347/g.40179  ORF Transcript_22347/g.40179 Transcript_22347/m.40179 type:complete len:246 (-) Transcript_22347:736-1473(-)